MQLRAINLLDQGLLAAIDIAEIDKVESRSLQDAVLNGRSAEVEDRIHEVYSIARPVDFSVDFPRLPSLPAFRQRIDSMSDQNLLDFYFETYADIASDPDDPEPFNRLVVSQTSFGDVTHNLRKKALGRNYNDEDYSNDPITVLQRSAK
jgi:hypothetical protein